VLIKACLNGNRSRGEHPRIPFTTGELARDAEAVAVAGAGAVHVHPRGSDGLETLEARSVGRAVRAVREAGRIPVGVTTAGWILPDPADRVRAVSAWGALDPAERPDFASVNLSEEGVAELCEALLGAGIGVEAGLASTGDAAALVTSGLAGRCVRVLVETQESEPGAAVADAAAIDALLDAGGVLAPRLYHGDGPATWAVIGAALRQGRDVRIGLEDVLTLPDGSVAADNAQLVATAVAMVRS